MRFAGSNSGSRGANYAAAGKAGADALAQSFATMRKTGPQYDELSKTAMAVEAEKQQAAWKAQARVGTAAIKASETVNKQGIVSQAEKTIDKREAGQIRKAGMLAGVSSVLGGGAIAAFGGDDTDDSWKDKFDAQSDQIDALTLQILQRQTPSDTRAPFEFKDYPTAPPLQGGSNSPKSTGGSDTASGDTSSNLGGQPFDLSKLTDEDYRQLGYVISSEAQLGTDDEYGVAANVLTRLQSGNYGSTIGEIIRAPGQYEGVQMGNSRYSPEIEARLRSPEGQKKIQEAFRTLDGRTEFKGQALIRNRVPSEDPMFSPGGNFYHYAGQT